MMVLKSFVTLFIAWVEVGPSNSDLLVHPLLEVNPQHINIEEFIQIICKHERGTSCQFYTDQTPAHFQSTPGKTGVCQLSVSGIELLQGEAHQKKTEVNLSCSVELNTRNQSTISQRSETKTIEVIVSFGRVHIQASKPFNKEEDLKLRCEAAKGTHCHFYVDRNKLPFRSAPYRQEYNLCHLSVSGRELLVESGGVTIAQVFLSCAVELEIEGYTVTSQRSELIPVEVEGLEYSDVATAVPITTNVQNSTPSNFNTTGLVSVLTPTVAQTEGQYPYVFIWVAAGEFFSLMATAGLSVCYFKYKRDNQYSERYKH
ncbi:uncharacterized protein [Lepisosteus oculatus]|uniref:uncharacterized protein isoform X2 n=1 Tax=Lepisosteus oculatus TaxID=7918 RepID=UPI00073FF2F5|nr:PREDICTED: uncharacterized protein LOC107076743 [Lepisosteus oculatus]